MATQNRVLGKGKLFFDQFATGTTTKQGERYFGNTPELSYTIESETLDHFDSDNGVRVKDDSVILETNRTGAFVTDNIDSDNVALFLLGTKSTHTQAATPIADESATVLQGRYYQLGATASNPQGVRNVTVVSVADDLQANTPTDYVLDTDYTLDAVTGRIEIIEGGGIADDATVYFNYTPAAETRDRIISSSDSIEGALRFVSANPKGDAKDYYFPKVQLTPNGDYALKGDEWQQIGFNIEILKLNDTTESIYVDGRAA